MEKPTPPPPLPPSPTQIKVKEFSDLINLKTLIKERTCFKSPENLTCFDLMLTNPYSSFHKSCAIETGSSDFHKMSVTVMKSYFHKKE